MAEPSTSTGKRKRNTKRSSKVRASCVSPTKKARKCKKLYEKYRNVRLQNHPDLILNVMDDYDGIYGDSDEDSHSDVASNLGDTVEEVCSDDERRSVRGEATSLAEASVEGEVDAHPSPPTSPPNHDSDESLPVPPANTWVKDNNRPPIVLPFTGTPGLAVDKPTTPLGFLQLFFTRELLEYFTDETNRYALQCFRSRGKECDWCNVTVVDIAHYLGLTILMGVLPAARQWMYWAVGKPYYVPIFTATMPYRRYKQIARYFHFCNNEALIDPSDRLAKVRTVMEYLVEKFKAYYLPNKELSLDEGVLGWRGRLIFKVYNPDKPDKYGIKLYILCEAKSGYVFNFSVYHGVGTTIKETVTSLIDPIKHCGYTVYMDNFYNSVSLADTLYHECGTHCCGTLRLPRGAPKDLQKVVKDPKFPVHEVEYRRKDNTFIVCWKDKRLVSMISTCHNAATHKVTLKRKKKIGGRTRMEKITVDRPKMIHDYNKNMSGVDHFDQMVKYYKFVRRTPRWTKKMISFLLQMAMFNAHHLYTLYYTPEKKTRKTKVVERTVDGTTTSTTTVEKEVQKKLDLFTFHEVLYTKLIHFNLEEWPYSNKPVQPRNERPSAMPYLSLPVVPGRPNEDNDGEEADIDEEDESPVTPPMRKVAVRRRLYPSPAAASSAVPTTSDTASTTSDSVSTTSDTVPSTSDTGASESFDRYIYKDVPYQGLGSGKKYVDPPCRLDSSKNHLLVRLPKRLSCRVCRVQGKRKDTPWKCGACNMPLCALNCPYIYHSSIHLSGSTSTP